MLNCMKNVCILKTNKYYSRLVNLRWWSSLEIVMNLVNSNRSRYKDITPLLRLSSNRYCCLIPTCLSDLYCWCYYGEAWLATGHAAVNSARCCCCTAVNNASIRRQVAVASLACLDPLHWRRQRPALLHNECRQLATRRLDNATVQQENNYSLSTK